jgi:hypothetical protein
MDILCNNEMFGAPCGCSTLQKCIVVVLMLTYGVIVNALYEYCCMGKTQPWKVC